MPADMSEPLRDSEEMNQTKSVPGVRIDILPDDVLLRIFDFHMIIYSSFSNKKEIEVWQSLVHVCRRWRNLVFGSPRRLKLRCCSPNTQAKDTLDVWPALPLVVEGSMDRPDPRTDNIVVALRQSNRVHKVYLQDLDDWHLEQVLAAMDVSFPELTVLRLYSKRETTWMPAIPDSFLGGSAPRLQFFATFGIPFLGLPKLLLSAPHLVTLWVSKIPHSGYISPEAIVIAISVMSGLRTLSLQFESPQSHPDQGTRRLPPSKRSILPALDEFSFKGATEYLEEFVSLIDTPRLNKLVISFFNQIDFDCPRLAQFIDRTPRALALNCAHVQLNAPYACVKLRHRTKAVSGDIQIAILCNEQDWQLSSMEQICSRFLSVSTIEDLYIEHQSSHLVWKNDAIEDTLWWQLFLPFTGVKNLYLFKEFAPGIAAALRQLDAGRITVVLPSLQNIFVEGLEPTGPLQENIKEFVAARKLSDHPITVSAWSRQ